MAFVIAFNAFTLANILTIILLCFATCFTAEGFDIGVDDGRAWPGPPPPLAGTLAFVIGAV